MAIRSTSNPLAKPDDDVDFTDQQDESHAEFTKVFYETLATNGVDMGGYGGTIEGPTNVVQKLAA